MQMVKMGKLCVAKVEKKDFFIWVKSKIDINEFYKSSEKEKREVFLLWKHGFTNKESNESLEEDDISFSMMVNHYKHEDWENLETGTREYYQSRIKWIDHCNSIWHKIQNNMRVLSGNNK